MTVADFVEAKLNEGRKQVASTRNTAAYCSVIVEVARAVVDEYPNRTPEEIESVLARFSSEEDTLRRTKKLDCTMALNEASRLLHRK